MAPKCGLIKLKKIEHQFCIWIEEMLYEEFQNKMQTLNTQR